MKRTLKGIGYTLGGILIALFLLLCLVWLTEWRPKEQDTIFHSTENHRLPSDTLTILTWNTGYAGLGDDMDFFMDGGTRTRTSRERTEQNLEAISAFLAVCDADIILLQEVDIDSRRSYRIDELAAYRKALPGYHAHFAPNYRSAFVPVPLKSPLGKVESGIVLFSKVPPKDVIRYQYPSRFPFPVSAFNLKRGLLSARFLTRSGQAVLINNTHNTAYDTGGMRAQEMEFLRDRLLRQDEISITGGDWNQHPPGYRASPAEVDDAHFSPVAIEAGLFPAGWSFHYDGRVPSARYLYEPYGPETTTTTIDFFLASPGIRCLEVKTIDLGFRNSDHHPVIGRFVIE